jgi:dipeptidyl aminopeptidase/acylaminoacyl peptidase
VRVALPGGETQVVTGIEPSAGIAVSPNGRRLVYSTCQEIGALHRLRAGEKPTPLLQGGRWADSHVVRAGRQLLFGSDRAGAEQVFLADLATGGVRAVGPPGSQMPELSPDGSLVVFEDRAGGGLAVVRLAGGAVRHLTTERGDAYPSFTHDGREVVFTRGAAGGTRVLAVPVAGGAPRSLGLDGATQPLASPTADRLVYSRLTAAGRALMSADLQGRGERLVAPKLPPGQHFLGGFSPDGKRVLVARSGVGELHEVTLDGTAPPRLIATPTVGEIMHACYAPDGDGYVVSMSRWEGDLWLAEGRFL